MTKPVYVSSDHFNWRKDGPATCEHSDLRKHFSVGDWPQNFYIRSERTGDTKLFLFDGFEKDGEGDIQVGNYIHPGDARVPRVVIFND